MKQILKILAVISVVLFVPLAAQAQVERVDLIVEGMT